MIIAAMCARFDMALGPGQVRARLLGLHLAPGGSRSGRTFRFAQPRIFGLSGRGSFANESTIEALRLYTIVEHLRSPIPDVLHHLFMSFSFYSPKKALFTSSE